MVFAPTTKPTFPIVLAHLSKDCHDLLLLTFGHKRSHGLRVYELPGWHLGAPLSGLQGRPVGPEGYNGVVLKQKENGMILALKH